MRLRWNLRAAIGLLSAYAVALQAILLAAAPLAAAGGLGASPICSTAERTDSHPSPAGHKYDCIAACLACCSGVTAATAAPPAPIVYLPKLASKVVGAVEIAPASLLRAIRAHRPRAPPVG